MTYMREFYFLKLATNANATSTVALDDCQCVVCVLCAGVGVGVCMSEWRDEKQLQPRVRGCPRGEGGE